MLAALEMLWRNCYLLFYSYLFHPHIISSNIQSTFTLVTLYLPHSFSYFFHSLLLTYIVIIYPFWTYFISRCVCVNAHACSCVYYNIVTFTVFCTQISHGPRSWKRYRRTFSKYLSYELTSCPPWMLLCPRLTVSSLCPQEEGNLSATNCQLMFLKVTSENLKIPLLFSWCSSYVLDSE